MKSRRSCRSSALDVGIGGPLQFAECPTTTHSPSIRSAHPRTQRGETMAELLTETVLEPGLAVTAMEAGQVIEPVLAKPHQPKVSRPGRAVLSLLRSIG